MIEINEYVPQRITQGERSEWTQEFEDYPSNEYSLEYRFRGPGPGINVTATAGTGSGFAAAITAAQSMTLSVGEYGWQAWLTEIADATNTFPIAEGTCYVDRGFASEATVTHELRTPAKIALDAIDAALANAATSDQMEYEIETPAGRRRVKRMSREELVSLRKHYAGIVANERLATRVRAGKPFAKAVKVRMRSV